MDGRKAQKELELKKQKESALKENRGEEFKYMLHDRGTGIGYKDKEAYEEQKVGIQSGPEEIKETETKSEEMQDWQMEWGRKRGMMLGDSQHVSRTPAI